jgi:hypothetical protein
MKREEGDNALCSERKPQWAVVESELESSQQLQP